MLPIGFLSRGSIAITLSAISLAFVTSVSAQCAWVLWWEQDLYSFSYRTADANVPGGKTQEEESKSWNILGAHPTHAACESHREWKIDDMLKNWRKQKAEAKRGKHTVDHEPGSNIISQSIEYVDEYTSHFSTRNRYLYLPDTIDPRGK